MLLFDIGDHADRMDSLTEGLAGKGNVRLLNDLGYHGVTIGNNEGITFAKEDLDSLYDEANFHVFVANLFHQNGQRPDWAKAYHIHHLNNGISVGVIGVTIPFYAFYEQLGWRVADPFQLLPELVSTVRNQADIVVLLSHLGYGNDLRIAEKLEGIDVILGAHTHHLLQEGQFVNGTLITQAGKFGDFVGKVKLIYAEDLKQVVYSEAACVPVERMEEDQKTVQLVRDLRKEGEARLNERVVVLEKPIPVSWREQSPLAALLAESLKEWCGTEIAMVNAGVLLEGLPSGEVTKGDLHRVCPHPINPCAVKLKGSELKEIIAQALTDEMIELEIKGFGFRGKMMGIMVYDGIEVETQRLSDGKEHPKTVTVKGKPLDPKKTYDVATIDMFTFGRLYPSIALAKEKVYYLPEMLRDLLAWKLKLSPFSLSSYI